MKKIIEEDTHFQSQVSFGVHPKVYVDTLPTGVGTPSVANRTCFVSAAGATVITNFLDGTEGQTIRILGNGNVIVVHNANIKTNVGINKTLNSNLVYSFTLFSGVWYEGE